MTSRHRSIGKAALTGAGLLALSACTGVSVVSQPYYDYSFASNELGYAAQFGPVPVLFRGAPLPSPAAAQDLVAALNAHRSAPPTFVVAGPEARSPYLLVLAFGQAGSGVNYCAGADAGGSGGPGHITGTFCLGPRLRAQAVAGGAPPTGQVSDPQLAASVNALVTALLSPDMDPQRRRGLSTAQGFTRR